MTLNNDLTSELHAATGEKEKLTLLMRKWGFLLPMATAILTILYPKVFTVYDIRVCDALKDHHSLANKTATKPIWSGYQSYLQAVQIAAPATLSLRDKDRWL